VLSYDLKDSYDIPKITISRTASMDANNLTPDVQSSNSVKQSPSSRLTHLQNITEKLLVKQDCIDKLDQPEDLVSAQELQFDNNRHSIKIHPRFDEGSLRERHKSLADPPQLVQSEVNLKRNETPLLRWASEKDSLARQSSKLPRPLSFSKLEEFDSSKEVNETPASLKADTGSFQVVHSKAPIASKLTRGLSRRSTEQLAPPDIKAFVRSVATTGKVDAKEWHRLEASPTFSDGQKGNEVRIPNVTVTELSSATVNDPAKAFNELDRVEPVFSIAITSKEYEDIQVKAGRQLKEISQNCVKSTVVYEVFEAIVPENESKDGRVQGSIENSDNTPKYGDNVLPKCGPILNDEIEKSVLIVSPILSNVTLDYGSVSDVIDQCRPASTRDVSPASNSCSRDNIQEALELLKTTLTDRETSNRIRKQQYNQNQATTSTPELLATLKCILKTNADENWTVTGNMSLDALGKDMCFIDEDDHQDSDHLPTLIQSPTTSFGSCFDDVSKSLVRKIARVQFECDKEEPVFAQTNITPSSNDEVDQETFSSPDNNINNRGPIKSSVIIGGNYYGMSDVGTNTIIEDRREKDEHSCQSEIRQRNDVDIVLFAMADRHDADIFVPGDIIMASTNKSTYQNIVEIDGQHRALKNDALSASQVKIKNPEYNISDVRKMEADDEALVLDGGERVTSLKFKTTEIVCDDYVDDNRHILRVDLESNSEATRAKESTLSDQKQLELLYPEPQRYEQEERSYKDTGFWTDHHSAYSHNKLNSSYQTVGLNTALHLTDSPCGGVSKMSVSDSSSMTSETSVKTDGTQTETCATEEVDNSFEIERLRAERQRICDILTRCDYGPSRARVQAAEARLNYGIGQTDTLLGYLEHQPVTSSSRDITGSVRFGTKPEEISINETTTTKTTRRSSNNIIQNQNDYFRRLGVRERNGRPTVSGGARGLLVFDIDRSRRVRGVDADVLNRREFVERYSEALRPSVPVTSSSFRQKSIYSTSRNHRAVPTNNSLYQ